MSKELLIQVLTKELKIGEGIASDIASACTEEQLQAVAEYLQSISQSSHKHRIDNWDKYAIMMMTAFKSASIGQKAKSSGYTPKRYKAPTKAPKLVKQADKKDVWEFLNG